MAGLIDSSAVLTPAVMASQASCISLYAGVGIVRGSEVASEVSIAHGKRMLSMLQTNTCMLVCCLAFE